MGRGYGEELFETTQLWEAGKYFKAGYKAGPVAFDLLTMAFGAAKGLQASGGRIGKRIIKSMEFDPQDALRMTDDLIDPPTGKPPANRPPASKRSVWSLDPKVRGRRIEAAVSEEYTAAGWQRADDFINPSMGQPFKSDNFPLIDFQKGNSLTSSKSVDTTGKTWMSRMESHIRDLSTRGATVNGNPASMILDMRVQPGGMSAASPLVRYGRQRGVTVVIKEFP
jgi:hypothetical protein